MESSVVALIATELFELLNSDAGASADQIARKPNLMKLEHPGGRTGDGSMQAQRVRRAIAEAATELSDLRLSERDDPRDVNYPTAAETLLGIAQGTSGLTAASRRERAERYTGKSREAFARERYGPSHEKRLMAALAQVICNRELDHRVQRQRTDEPRVAIERCSTLLRGLHHSMTRIESATIEHFASNIGVDLPDSETHRDLALAHFSVAAAFLKDEVGHSEPPIAPGRGRLVRGGFLAAIYLGVIYDQLPVSLSAFRETADLFAGMGRPLPGHPESSAEALEKLRAARSPILRSWRQWWEQCDCRSGGNTTKCPVHVVTRTLKDPYLKTMRSASAMLDQALAHPTDHERWFWDTQGVDEVLHLLNLRPDALDLMY
jgi:hypothetical protein